MSKIPIKMNKETKIISMFAFSAFLIIFMIIFIYQTRQNENYKNIKEDKKNYLVYTKYEKKIKTYSIRVPYININSDVVKAINEDIDMFTSEFVQSKNAMISYDYDINGIILSVIIKIVDYDTKYAPQPYFRSYNINLNTLELISDEAILEYYGITDSDVEVVIENKFMNYYHKLVEKDYYAEDECSYECFLKYRGFDSYMEDINYYINNGNLYVYKPFIFYSIYGEEDFFKDKHFKILIVKKDS